MKNIIYSRKSTKHNPPPPDWDICHRNGETLWRCPAYRILSGTGEIQRCTVCKKKCKWDEHLNGRHKFNIKEEDDDPLMISIIKERIKERTNMNDEYIHKAIIDSVAMIAGQIDIPISKASSKQFRNFVYKLLDIGIDISKKYTNSIPDLTKYTYSLTEKRINPRMQLLSLQEKEKRFKKFKKKIFVNVLCDAGSVLGFKCVHAMIANPGIDDAIPYEVYENHNFTSDDYYNFFNDVLNKVKIDGLCIAGIIIDNLPAQMLGITNLISRANDTFFKSIIIVPCLCHLSNLIFITSMRNCEVLKNIVLEIQKYVNQIRKPEVIKYLKLLCPKIVITRWLYIMDSLKFIFDNSDSLYSGMKNGYPIPVIPNNFIDIYEIFIPIKIINILSEKRDSRLFNYVQHFQFSISYFKYLNTKYSENHQALEMLNEVTVQFFARIKTWKCFHAMIFAYLCTPQGKNHINTIYRNTIINSQDDVDYNIFIPEDCLFIPNFKDVEKQINNIEMHRKLNDIQNLYVFDNTEYEEEEEYMDNRVNKFTNNYVKHKNILKQKKITDFINNENRINDKHILNNEDVVLTDDEEILEEEDDDDDKTYNTEIETQREMTLNERLNQCLFWGEKTTMFKIAKDYLNKYSTHLGYSPQVINSLFIQWINSDNEDLPFLDFNINVHNIDNMWENVLKTNYEWSNFASIAQRHICLGTSEADVERLFSKQKVAMGRHMTNLGTNALESRLILKTTK